MEQCASPDHKKRTWFVERIYLILNVFFPGVWYLFNTWCKHWSSDHILIFCDLYCLNTLQQTLLNQLFFSSGVLRVKWRTWRTKSAFLNRKNYICWFHFFSLKFSLNRFRLLDNSSDHSFCLCQRSYPEHFPFLIIMELIGTS